jgi:hypothetical protein
MFLKKLIFTTILKQPKNIKKSFQIKNYFLKIIF